MAKKIKKIYNTKLLYRWSLPLWFTLLFIVVTIAPIVVSLFMPAITFIGDQEYKITSLDFVNRLMQQPSASLDAFVASVVAPIKGTSGNELIGMLLEVAVNYVVPVFGLLVALFDVILLIFFLVGLLGGRFFHWKGPFSISLWATIQGLFYFGLLVGLSFYLNGQFPNVPEMASYKLDFIFSAAYFGVMLVSTIVLGIIYSAGFKGKEFIPNKEYLDNYIQQMNYGMRNAASYVPQPIIINNNTGDANNSVTPANNDARYVTKVKKVQVSEVDQTLNYISGHAYAKNVNLQAANIPEGVESVGASAFANCINLKVITIPVTVKEIGYNAFFNCKSLQKIVYAGTKEQWQQIKRGSNWLSKAGTDIVSCIDGAIQVNPYRR